MNLDELITKMENNFFNKKTIGDSIKVNFGLCLVDEMLKGCISVGTITQLYGTYGSGKTIMCLQAIKKTIDDGGICLYFDLENKLDINYVKKVGIDLNKLFVINETNTLENVEYLTKKVIESDIFDLIVYDSISALISNSNTSFNVDNLRYEEGHLIDFIEVLLMNHNTTVLFTSQVIQKLYTNKKIPTGGFSVKKNVDNIISLNKVSLINLKNKIQGMKLKATVMKSKDIACGDNSEFEFTVNEGISVIGNFIDYAVKYNVLKRVGGYFYYNDVKISHGRKNLKDLLSKNKALYKEIEYKIEISRFSL